MSFPQFVNNARRAPHVHTTEEEVAAHASEEAGVCGPMTNHGDNSAENGVRVRVDATDKWGCGLPKDTTTRCRTPRLPMYVRHVLHYSAVIHLQLRDWRKEDLEHLSNERATTCNTRQTSSADGVQQTTSGPDALTALAEANYGTTATLASVNYTPTCLPACAHTAHTTYFFSRQRLGVLWVEGRDSLNHQKAAIGDAEWSAWPEL